MLGLLLAGPRVAARAIPVPEPVPADTDYASVIESDVPIVVQYSRLDSRQAENALLSSIAYAASND